ncbi:MAG: hypothetical protein C4576_33905 [Desulfobacteraceae bacterium]|nr:MAG: hypothetical protein C4576_33905 [Desulfobacteraceae bacterium]
MNIGDRFNRVALLSVLAAFTAGCGTSTSEHGGKIVLGVETVAHASPVWIAENKGYFREEGITVEIREFESGRTALRTMLNDEGIDISTAAQTPVISHSFNRSDYAIVGNMVYSDNDVKMLGRRDRGINNPSDLKGKTVGVTGGSSGHFFLALFLAFHQLQMSDVNILDIEATHLPQALVEEKVDAIVTWEPHIHYAKKALGDKALLLPGGNIYREDFYFIAKKDFINGNSEDLKRFLKAIEKSEQFILKNKPEAMEIVARRLNLDREVLKETWDDFQFSLSLDQSILTSLEDESKWALNSGMAEGTTTPNYLHYIYVDALKAVKPEAVSIAGK